MSCPSICSDKRWPVDACLLDAAGGKKVKNVSCDVLGEYAGGGELAEGTGGTRQTALVVAVQRGLSCGSTVRRGAGFYLKSNFLHLLEYQ